VCVPLTLDILEIGARGDGIASHEGERYFVPFTLPGEVVAALPLGRRGEGIAARLLDVLSPSRHRQPPACAHFGVCGGCALQHWRHDVYSAWKAGLIDRALRQRGVVSPVFEPPLLGMPGERRRVDLVLRHQGRRVVGGFHERGATRVVDIEACVIVRPSLMALLQPLRAALSEILPPGAAADAIANETDDGLDVLLRPHRPFTLSIGQRQTLAGLAERANLARLSWGERVSPDPIVTRRRPLLTLDGVTVEPPPGAFLQATKRGERAMRDAVKAWVGDTARLADLFAGVGSLTLGRNGRLALFESDKPSVMAIEAAARKSGGNRVRVERRDLFRHPLLLQELSSFDAVVLDPPRAGAAAQVGELARSKVKRVVYAACDPGSFARDARTLQEGGYRLEKLKAIDQFLWSGHVESIALFVR
jgi:23S rRNA (uracil1939-C5)-methyltransferase